MLLYRTTKLSRNTDYFNRVWQYKHTPEQIRILTDVTNVPLLKPVLDFHHICISLSDTTPSTVCTSPLCAEKSLPICCRTIKQKLYSAGSSQRNHTNPRRCSSMASMLHSVSPEQQRELNDITVGELGHSLQS